MLAVLMSMKPEWWEKILACLLYTSDAADD